VRAVYVTKAVDEDSPFVATQVRWIRALASRPEIDHVHVLTPRLGRASFPANVSIECFGQAPWPRRAVALWRRAARLRRAEVDFIFLAQGGGPYPALLLPVKLALRRPLYQWKAHPDITWRMRLYARYCDDLVFTPTEGSFPMELAKIRVVGHGIDTELFASSGEQPSRDLLLLGRVSPAKRVDIAIRAVALCRDRTGAALGLDVLGPSAGRDEAHLRDLRALAAELGVADHVRFLGPVGLERVPSLLQEYRATLNLSTTALDKAAAESMATGVPLITTNPNAIDVRPPALRPALAASRDDPESVADAIQRVMAWNGGERTEVGRRLRDVIVRDHSLDAFFGKVLTEIRAHMTDHAPTG
jgi:glycosyltransferase involved in cell wall biosynthesis